MTPTVIIGWGNPSRGDDALGPALCDRIEAWLATTGTAVDVVQDFQLQIEHALDLAGRRRVLFIDAAVNAQAPFSFTRIGPEEDTSHTTHALSPQAVLATAERLGQPLPEAYLLCVAGVSFELGEPLSAVASGHLEAADQFLRGLMAQDDHAWPASLNPSNAVRDADRP